MLSATMVISTNYVAQLAWSGTLLLGILTAAFFTVVYRWRQCRELGPKAWPIIGTALEHVQNYHRMHDWLLFYFERNPTISSLMPFGQMFYYTVETENVKYMLKTNFKNFPKGETFHDRMEVLLGNGIFNTDGETWKQQRKTASVEFSMRSLRDFSSVVFKDEACKLAHLLLQVQHEDKSIDMQDLFMRMTLDSIGKVGFGVEIGTLPSQFPLPENSFAKAFDIANEIVTRRFIDPLWKLKRVLGVGSEAQLEGSIKVLDAFTYGVISQRKLEIEREIISTRQAGSTSASTFQAPKLDIITRFLQSGKGLDEFKDHTKYKMLRDIVLNFVIAGRDTTAVTLSWFVYSLTEKPEVAHRLYLELCDFEKRKRGDPWVKSSHPGVSNVNEFSTLLNYDSLRAEELPYLQAALSETLRLFPAVPLDPKGIKEDDVLPDGTRLKKGNLISYSPYCMARMLTIWGADAKEFKPERWLHEGKFQSESEYKFATFQAGLRTCLGKDSAYLQMKMTAAILCRFFEFERVEGHCVRYRMMAILSMASGLKVTVRSRLG